MIVFGDKTRAQYIGPPLMQRRPSAFYSNTKIAQKCHFKLLERKTLY